MTCDRTDLLIGLAEDELDPSERSEVESHVDGCAPCQSKVDDFRGLSRGLATLEPERPSQAARDQAYQAVMAAMAVADPGVGDPGQFGEPASPVQRPSGILIRFLQGAAAAACLVIAVTLTALPDGSDHTASAPQRQADPSPEAADQGSAPAGEQIEQEALDDLSRALRDEGKTKGDGAEARKLESAREALAQRGLLQPVESRLEEAERQTEEALKLSTATTGQAADAGDGAGEGLRRDAADSAPVGDPGEAYDSSANADADAADDEVFGATTMTPPADAPQAATPAPEPPAAPRDEAPGSNLADEAGADAGSAPESAPAPAPERALARGQAVGGRPMTGQPEDDAEDALGAQTRGDAEGAPGAQTGGGADGAMTKRAGELQEQAGAAEPAQGRAAKVETWVAAWRVDTAQGSRLYALRDDGSLVADPGYAFARSERRRARSAETADGFSDAPADEAEETMDGEAEADGARSFRELGRASADAVTRLKKDAVAADRLGSLPATPTNDARVRQDLQQILAGELRQRTDQRDAGWKRRLVALLRALGDAHASLQEQDALLQLRAERMLPGPELLLDEAESR